MTAQKLSKGFKSNFKLKLKSNRKFTVVGLIMNLLSTPLFLTAYIIYSIYVISYNEKHKEVTDTMYQNYHSFNGMYIVIPIIALIIIAFIGVFIALNTFNYLFKRSNVDMYLSLPVRTKERFFSDFLSGLTSYLVPYILSGILTMILSFIAQPLAKKAFSKTSEYFRSFDYNIPYTMFKLVLCGFVILLSIYVITILITTFCGNILECIMYTGLINIFIPLSFYIGGELLYGNLFGVGSTSVVLPFIHRTSPIGSVICIAPRFIFGISTKKGINIYTYWMIPYLIFITALFVFSYFVYKKRKAEQVGKPIVFKPFYYFMVTLIIFTISSLFVLSAGFADLENNIIPLIIISGIIYFVFEVVTNRGYKKLWQGGIRYAVTIVSIIALIFLANKSEGFGIVYKVPDADDVVSVDISYLGSENFVYGMGYDNYKYSDKTTFKDKEIINTIIDVHKDVLEEHKKERKDNNDIFDSGELFWYIDISYTMKNGSVISRFYSLSQDQYIKLFSIDISDEFTDKIIGLSEKYSSKFGHEISIISLDENSDYIERILTFSSKEEFKDFLEAYVKDIKSMTLEEYQKYRQFVFDNEDDGNKIIIDQVMRIEGLEYLPNTSKYLIDKGINIKS